MAIINLENQQYMKIIYEGCKVENDMIYVHCKVYLNENERLKEKNRLNEQNIFFNNIDQYRAKYQNTTDENLLKELNYVNLFVQDLSNWLFNDYVNNLPETEIFLLNPKQIMLDLGYKKEWVEDKPQVIAVETINEGEYNQEIVNYKMFYDAEKRNNPSVYRDDI